METRTQTIRRLNDELRTSRSPNGKTVITSGIQSLGAVAVARLIQAIAAFDQFNGDKIAEGEVTLMRDPLEVMAAFQNGVENGISFFTGDLLAEQLQALSDLMQAKVIAAIHIA